MSKTKSIALILGVLIMSFLIGYLIFAWTEPTAPPPEINVSAPINTSINAQSKEGALVVGANSSVTTGLIVQYGNVGIGGTATPGSKLAVDGVVSATGFNNTNPSVTTYYSPSRELDTWYRNTSGKTMVVYGRVSTASGAFGSYRASISPDLVAIYAIMNENVGDNFATDGRTLTIIVPNNWYYRFIRVIGGGTLDEVHEQPL